jgi:arylformamidase
MAIRWCDVSIPMRPGMTVWPGDPPFDAAPLNRMAAGNTCNTTWIGCSTHIGTHVDAPWHFEENGKRIDAMDSSLYFGHALVIDLPALDMIQAEDLGTSPLPHRVLIKTRNSDYPVNGPFLQSYVALAPDAAQRLVDDGVKLTGVDYLSVAPFRQKGQETHHRLLRHGVLVVEGLCLRGIPAGTHLFVVLPLPLIGLDGAPCRAFIGREEADP